MEHDKMILLFPIIPILGTNCCCFCSMLEIINDVLYCNGWLRSQMDDMHLPLEGDITVPGAPLENDDHMSTLDEPIMETVVRIFNFSKSNCC